MTEQTIPGTQEVRVPEPSLTPETIVARARGLIPAIREQQDEAERLGHHTAELDKKFTEAGLYRIVQPKRFGGYAFDVLTYWKAMLAVAEGDPGTGWGLGIGAQVAHSLGAWFGEAGQLDLFGPDGDFRCSYRAVPMGTAKPVDGGYVVRGTWDYCSGSGHATHFMGGALVPGRESEGMLTICTPIENVTVLPDWGDGAIIGMNSSGSNSVQVEDVFVPEHCTCPSDWTHNTTTAAPGMALHDEPLFCGRVYTLNHASVVIPVIGAARAALAEFEHIIVTKKTSSPPLVPRYTVEEYQRHYGQALALIDSAEAILCQCGERYMELAERWHRTGEPFTREDDARMFTMIQVAARMAVRATSELFAAAGSSAAKRGARMQRYYRDVSAYIGHISARQDIIATDVARIHFGLPDDLF